MWEVFTFDLFINPCSLFTNICLFLATIKEKNIANRTKALVLFFVLCDLSTTSTYLYIVFNKIRRGEKLVYPWTARGGGIINWTLFVHEAAFFMFAMNIFLLATERLLYGKYYGFFQKHGIFCNFMTFLAILFSIGISLFASHLQHIDAIRVPPAITMNVLQFTGVWMLFITTKINEKKYLKRRGEDLELRYQVFFLSFIILESAQTYYYNVTLFRYLIGSACSRFFAFNCIIILIVFPVNDEAFGWLSFFYHNLNALSNSIFPWIIILRNRRSYKCYVKIQPEQGERQINDLRGNAIDTRPTGEIYFKILEKAW